MQTATVLQPARRALFANLESPDTVPEFFRHVADDVDWTLHGKHPLAARYRTKAEFLRGTIEVLGALTSTGMRFHVDRLHVAEEITVAEMHSTAIGRDGAPYDQIYAWICTFDSDTIVRVHAYVDSVAVIEFLERNGYRP